MKMEFFRFEELKYIIRYPDGYEPGEKYPVILYLHGSGGRGDDLGKMSKNPYFALTEKHSSFPFVTVAPQCWANTWFDLFEQLRRMAQKIVTEPYADPRRIYLMGTSMGGYAAWQLAMSLPEIFAAVIPICGGGMYWNAGRLLNVPVWAFHGGIDPTVSVEESKKMVDAVNKKGGRAKLTIYPENKHDAWTNTYENEEVFQWLLSHKKETVSVAEDTFKDSKLYG